MDIGFLLGTERWSRKGSQNTPFQRVIIDEMSAFRPYWGLDWICDYGRFRRGLLSVINFNLTVMYVY